MINSLITGITSGIYAEFGDDYDIYTENIEQGLEPPCFFIKVISPANEIFLHERRKLTNKFLIQYFPSSNKPKQECNTVIERLTYALEYITADEKLIMGSGITSEIVDDVLNVLVNYDFFGYRVKDAEEVMETLEWRGGLESGD